MNKSIQFILSLGLLFSTLVLNTGCSGQDSGAYLTVPRHRGGQPINPYQRNDFHQRGAGGVVFQPSAIPTIEDFLGTPLGNLHSAELLFSPGEVSIFVWDDQALQTNEVVSVTLMQDHQSQPGSYSYSDAYGTIYFEPVQDTGMGQTLFNIHYENYDDMDQIISSGTLGSAQIAFCQLEGSC